MSSPSEEFRERLYTIGTGGRRKWVYPVLVKGRFLTRRALVAYPLMAFYLLMPWLTINGDQAIELNIVARRFVVFGTVFWASDTQFLVLLLGALLFLLFFFTALFGRVWCGWACPETVFLEFLFRPIERLIEGDVAAQKRLNAAPWNAQKIFRKGVKHFICAASSWIIASTFLAYFVGREPLLRMMTEPPWQNPLPFIVTVFVMGVMAFQFGWFREQFCSILCPYARFQSVMMDASSITVGYDKIRGEPRGKFEKSDGTRQHGDCIDCGLCVRVCPTGIDIRNGLQLECISCTACIDACDSIMDRVNRPRGLIRYDTEARLQGGGSSWLRPRVVVYAAILLVYGLYFTLTLSSRQVTEAQILRGSGDKPYEILADGRVMNHLSVHFSNKGRFAQRFTLSSPDSEVQLITPLNPFPVGAEQLKTAPIFLTVAPQLLNKGKHPVSIEITTDRGEHHELEVTVIGPE